MNDQTGPDQTVADQTAAQLVTRHEIRRFAFAVGATSAIHHDLAAARARGYPDLVAPAFFFTTLGLSLGRFLPPDQLREDGLARDDEVVGRVVAGDTTIEWSGAIVAGDEVRVSQRQKLVGHLGYRHVAFRTDIVNRARNAAQ